MKRFSDLFEIRTYPSGETHVQFTGGIGDLHMVWDPTKPPVILFDRCFTFTDLCHAVVANRFLKRQGIDVEWFIPYFPFARDDRRQSARDGSCLELALDLAIEELDPVVFDPHSDVTSRLRFIHQRVLLHHVLDHDHEKDIVLVIPDMGATKKSDGWHAPSYPVVQGVKKRDPDTGKLSGFGVLDPNDDLDGSSCLIVDDICDGGGTFIGLAKELFAHGANDASLLVSHGLFTKGVDHLFEVFDEIIMAGDPFADINPPKVTVIDWADLYGKALIA